MSFGSKTLMGGTTLCPHCNTRFKIDEDQLEAHHGMVRCGHCLQAFDARPGYIPDQPSPQLELPILDEPVAPADVPPAEEVAGEAPPTEESTLGEETVPAAEPGPEEVSLPAEEVVIAETGLQKIDFDNLPDFDQPAAAAEDETLSPAAHAEEPATPTLAEQVAIVQDEDEDEGEPPARPPRWPWAIGAFLLLLALLAQAAYFFRVDLAAHLPALKPALNSYCQLLQCSVPLPQDTDLMSIESSDLEADPAHANQITLNALLRNRAPYAQAFPTWN